MLLTILTSYRHVNCLITMIMLTLTGMVPIEHILLVVFSFIYLFFLSKVAFPNFPLPDKKPIFNPKSKMLDYYVLLTAIVGLLLPMTYIFWGIFEGDPDSVKRAIQHLFLLSSQVFMEGVSFFGGFSMPIWVFVPVFYNSVRMFFLVAWVKYEVHTNQVGEQGSVWRLNVGKSIAVANFVMWVYNLFGLLLPVYLPRAFKKYFSAVSKKD